MSMVLQCKESGDFKPHPEGIHPATCVDVIDLGMVTTEFQGQPRIVNKLKVVFESEQKTDDGKNCTVSRNFTASLHPKSKLAEFLGKWRGRPVMPGESIDLAKLIGACCTLVISHQQNMVGKTYASIDAVSKPTKRLVASGGYDPAAVRQRIEEWKARQGGSNQSSVISHQTGSQGTNAGAAARPESRPTNEPARGDARPTTPPKSVAPEPAPALNTAYDPEVGF